MTVASLRLEEAPSDQEALRSLIRAFGLVQRLMEPYFAAYGISGAQWGVLRNLQRAEGEGLAGLRLTDLGDRLLVRPPTVTGVVNRLVRAGLVRRIAASDDLRAKQVSLTSKGRQLLRRVLRVHARQIQRLMCALSSGEQAQLTRLLGKLQGHLERLLSATEAATG